MSEGKKLLEVRANAGITEVCAMVGRAGRASSFRCEAFTQLAAKARYQRMNAS
jgi:hypothetical protein